MKKWTIMFFTVLFLFAAVGCAQEYYTIDQLREQAAEGWHNVYEAYGRKIVADIDITIPDVEQVPVEKLELARRESQIDEKEVGLNFVIRPEENVFGFYTSDFVEPISGKIEKKNEICIGNPNEWERMYAEGNELTLSDIVNVIKDALSVMQLDYRNWDLNHPYELRTFSFRDPSTKEVVAPGEYMVYFHQMVNEIPLLNHAGATYKQRTRGNATIRLDASVINEKMYDIVIPSVKTTEKLADDVPLCSLSKVISAIEKEIEAGHVRKIYDLEFGYVFYEDPDYVTKTTQTDHFYAIPVWQLNCLYMSNRQKELPEYGGDEAWNERDSLEYSSLVINAQTGEMQDFMSQAEDRAEYKGFISWDKVK